MNCVGRKRREKNIYMYSCIVFSFSFNKYFLSFLCQIKFIIPLCFLNTPDTRLKHRDCGLCLVICAFPINYVCEMRNLLTDYSSQHVTGILGDGKLFSEKKEKKKLDEGTQDKTRFHCKEKY